MPRFKLFTFFFFSSSRKDVEFLAAIEAFTGTLFGPTPKVFLSFVILVI